MSASLLLSEIHAQPAVLRRLLAHETDHIAQIAARLRTRWPRFVLIAARGSSDNAARYAQYLFGAHNRLPVALATPSLFTKYGAAPALHDALVIGISQSGAAPDLIAVVEAGREQGCATLAITNLAESPLARVADDTILLHADVENSVAATKTYTAQLMALAMLSCALGDDAARQAALARVPALVEPLLSAESESQIARAAERLAPHDHCVVIGRGYNYATVHEAALKAKELAYVVAEPYSSADFLHGPIALIDEGFPALVISPSGQVFAEVQQVLVEMVKRGAQPVVISDRDEACAQSATPIALSSDVPEWLSPLVAIVPAQLLAYHLSRARGFDPDQPRGLKKVTRTL